LRVLAIGLCSLFVVSPLPAQRSIPTPVPIGPAPVPTLPVPTGQGSLSGSLPQTTLPTPTLDTAWPGQTSPGVQVDASVGGDGAGAVVDHAADDEGRAFEYLERQAERTDLLGGTPVLGKMRRLRR
jgi:hypothetical protein